MVLGEYTIISLNIHICYSNCAYLHSYCRCVYYYFINFFSHLCSHQSLFPHILLTLPNHHSITTTTTHDIPITKSTKNKEKSNQNQSKPKIKPSMENSTTQNPKSNFQQKTHQPKPKFKSKLPSPLPWRACCFLCSWRACCCHQRREKQVLESYDKEKDQKIKSEEKRPWKQREDLIL